MPLSVQGLCDAEMTTPAAKARERARYATPGVVITPALWTSTPTPARPLETRSAIQPLDSRVSWPITACGLRVARIRSWPRARPIKYVLCLVSGNSPATPRIPSVPNNCLCWLIRECGKNSETSHEQREHEDDKRERSKSEIDETDSVMDR